MLVLTRTPSTAAYTTNSSQDEELQSFMEETIPDDPPLDPPIPFQLGTMSFAGSGDDSRSTQMFIAYG